MTVLYEYVMILIVIIRDFGGIKMKNLKKGLAVLSVLMAVLMALTACTTGEKVPDKARGEYTFVWEKAPLFTRYDVDSKFVLDGFGEGEYHKEGNVHKIKYTFNDPNIEISDKLTGIKYRGTVIDGELELYDGSPDSSMVSHFLFEKKKPY